MSSANDESYSPSYDSTNASEELQQELRTRQTGQNRGYDVTLANVTFGKKLGKGAFGTIFMAHDKRDPRKTVAVKCISKRRVAKKHLLKQLGLEISAHKSLVHPNILRFYNFEQDGRNVYFFLELAEYGDLLSYADSQKPDERELSSIFLQLGRALEYCHSMGLLHRDFKSENCLMTAARVPKLTDFGYCDKTDEDGNCKNPIFCGTTSFMAPEMIDEQPCSFPVDVWSFGVTIFDIMVGFSPFESRNRRDKRDKHERHEETYRKIQRIEVPWKDKAVARVTQNCEPLLRSIFVMPPEARPTMSELLQDDWFYL